MQYVFCRMASRVFPIIIYSKSFCEGTERREVDRIAQLVVRPVVAYLDLFNRLLDFLCGPSEEDSDGGDSERIALHRPGSRNKQGG